MDFFYTKATARIPMAQPLHISFDLLRFPFQHTSLCSPQFVYPLGSEYCGNHVITFGSDKRFEDGGMEENKSGREGETSSAVITITFGLLSVASVQPCKPVFMPSCLILLYVLEIDVWQMAGTCYFQIFSK
jgi:hypothetical protein